jgi:hypothetical protein
MHQILSMYHSRRPWTLFAIAAVKVGLVVAALLLLDRANLIFGLGIPALLLHGMAVAVIAALLFWTTFRRSAEPEPRRAPHERKKRLMSASGSMRRLATTCLSGCGRLVVNAPFGKGFSASRSRRLATPS